ncbi:MAG: DegT/DnrJ/EryC1/StrS family aminotransferase [Acidobacteria bacterium]|nr:MAG: DegT/DnrJ/EryC1/StrS family aminotransferase [Acidobacteriota bacterium]
MKEETATSTATVSGSETTVPFVDLMSPSKYLEIPILKAWRQTLLSAGYILGPQVESFEREFADLCSVRHAIGVANGTDALVLALKAAGVKPGSEVITAANSFIATAEAIVHSGAIPVFADIDPDYFTIDPKDVEKRVTTRTSAIVPVHLYGHPAAMDDILAVADRYKLTVIEDAAQAHGASFGSRMVGSMGEAGCFSFYPAKNLGACGDAGAVVTNDDEIAINVRKLRDHGGIQKYQHDVIGFNSRLDALQAAVLIAKMPYLADWNRQRREIAARYSHFLAGVPGIEIPSAAPHVSHVYHLYVIRVTRGNRDQLAAFLKAKGIHSGIHYPKTIPGTPAFGNRAGEWPVAEKYAEQVLSLPMHPELSEDQVRSVAKAIHEYTESVKELS